MFSVPEFLDRAKKGAGVETDYALAKVLGHKSQASVSNWRIERTMPDERAIVELCKLSGDDPRYVAVMIQAMRAANDDAASLWRSVANSIKGSAGAVLMTLAIAVILSASMPSEALAFTGAAPVDRSALLIMSNVIRRFLVRLLERLPALRAAH